MVCPPHNIDQLLLDAGLALLPSTGCAGFSVHKLARHAGVNLGMFHCGPLAALRAAEPAFEVRVQRHYHPEGLTSYNVIPGLIGAVLTMTRVVMTAPAMTRERERGTMDNLLSTPARQLEVMLGKIVPYILIGYVQVVVILLAARLLFDLPMIGSLWAAVAGAGGLHCGQSGGRIYFFPPSRAISCRPCSSPSFSSCRPCR